MGYHFDMISDFQNNVQSAISPNYELLRINWHNGLINIEQEEVYFNHL